MSVLDETLRAVQRPPGRRAGLQRADVGPDHRPRSAAPPTDGRHPGRPRHRDAARGPDVPRTRHDRPERCPPDTCEATMTAAEAAAQPALSPSSARVGRPAGRRGTRVRRPDAVVGPRPRRRGPASSSRCSGRTAVGQDEPAQGAARADPAVRGHGRDRRARPLRTRQSRASATSRSTAASTPTCRCGHATWSGSASTGTAGASARRAGRAGARVDELLARSQATSYAERAARAAVRRRAAAAARRAGAGDRPGRAAVRRAAAVARPQPPADGRRPDRPASPRARHRGAVRDPRDQPDAAAGRPTCSTSSTGGSGSGRPTR